MESRAFVANAAERRGASAASAASVLHGARRRRAEDGGDAVRRARDAGGIQPKRLRPSRVGRRCDRLERHELPACDARRLLHEPAVLGVADGDRATVPSIADERGKTAALALNEPLDRRLAQASSTPSARRPHRASQRSTWRRCARGAEPLQLRVPAARAGRRPAGWTAEMITADLDPRHGALVISRARALHRWRSRGGRSRRRR